MRAFSQKIQNLAGSVQLDSLEYKTYCECGDQKSKILQQKTCEIKTMNVVNSRQGQGFTLEIIKDIIESPKSHVYNDIKSSSFYCMDGRSQQNLLYTPGGDFGEFLLALHVYEGITKELDDDQIQNIFEIYLSSMESTFFYYCTDDLSIQHLEKDLNKSFNFDKLVDPFIQDQLELVNLLFKSENQGDNHLKLMLKYPQYYSIRIGLINGMIRAFFKIFWDKEHHLQNKLKVDFLTGKHQEQAFVEIRQNSCQDQAPLLKTQLKRDEVLQIFVNHIDAAQIRRKQLSDFFINTINKNQDKIDASVMNNRINRHGLAFLEITGSYIAKNIPFYTITFL